MTSGKIACAYPKPEPGSWSPPSVGIAAMRPVFCARRKSGASFVRQQHTAACGIFAHEPRRSVIVGIDSFTRVVVADRPGECRCPAQETKHAIEGAEALELKRAEAIGKSRSRDQP